MAKKAKKRGVKPGTKRGPYKKVRAKRKNIVNALRTRIPVAEWEAMNKAMADSPFTTSVGNLPSLISELTSTIDTLEAQLTEQIDRIKSILL